jgi:alkylhydroperoxidase family enzyme
VHARVTEICFDDTRCEHYDEPQLAAFVISIAAINAWNRVNAITRQPSGERGGEISQAFPE